MPFIGMLRWLLLAAATWLVGCDEDAVAAPPAERAADFRADAVNRSLEAASAVVRTRGFAAGGDPWRGFLVEHQAGVEEAPMRAGTCTVVLAAASAALRELHLGIYDADGATVAEAKGPGRAAARYCPSQSGTYYVAVRAAAGNGLFQVRRFRGPTGLDVRLDDVFREEAGDRP